MRVLMCLLLLASSSVPARAAELPPALRDVLALLGTMQMPALMRDMCAEQAPDAAPKNAEVHAAWRKRHAGVLKLAMDTLKAREDKFAPLLSQHTQGTLETLTDAEQFADTVLKGTAEKMGPDYMSKVCASYPDFITKYDAGFKEKIDAQIKAVEVALP